MTGSSRRRAALGALCAAGALVLIWACRSVLEGHLYVSGMGAAGMVTAPWFNLALLLVATAAVLVATAVPSAPARHRLLRLWPLSATLLASGAAFAFAGVVPCTDGCPVPFTPSSTMQDLLHVSAAVLGFAAAVLAVLQVWSAALSGAARAVSAITAVVIAVMALAGAIASLANWGGGMGGWFEFAATTVALAWMVAYALLLAFGRQEAVQDTAALGAMAPTAMAPGAQGLDQAGPPAAGRSAPERSAA